MRVPDTVSLVCTDHRKLPRLRSARANSNRTGKPIPPTTIAKHTGRMIIGSPTKPIRLSLCSANPALLKAETAWNTPCHTADSQLSVC